LNCLRGDHNLCAEWRVTYRAAAGEHPYFVNTFSDYVYLPPRHPIFKVPDELTDEEVVSLNCAMGTVFQGLRLAEARQGQTIVVQGAGGLGLYATAFAKDMGAARVIVIDGQEARLQLARELGASDTIDIRELRTPEERVQHIMHLTDRRGADIVVELVGLGELLQEGVSMLAAGGTFVEIGNIMKGRMATMEPLSLLQSKRIVGSNMYRPSLLPTILDFIVRNRRAMPLQKVISHRFTLAELNEAFAYSEWSGRKTEVIRSAIVP
jgi:threonine dehydrogenase-like Zn-dependent dehydrogenase